ncbi:MAG: hypothetical protein ABIK99_03900 [candidate division WOR-3 bacterium]
MNKLIKDFTFLELTHSPLAKSRLKEADKTFIIFIIIRREIEEVLLGN